MSGGDRWSGPRHAAFASHEQTRAAFHDAQARFVRATEDALRAGQRRFASPYDPAAEAAYRRAVAEEAAASRALETARETLLASLRGEDGGGGA